jgi:hypothetical protein
VRPSGQPRAKGLFPPKETFTEQEWWLSILRYGHQYTREMLTQIKAPPYVMKIFNQLDRAIWVPQLKRERESKETVNDRHLFSTYFAVERQEGEAKGEAERDYERALQLVKKGLFSAEKAIAEFDLSEEQSKRLRENVEASPTTP